MSEAVFVDGLTKAYNGKTVVNNLNLSVKSGRVFGLLGANGAGKSTTIECILGTKQADSGTVRLLGQDPKKKRRTLFERIGVQFQEGDYHKEIRVSELCEETASLYRNPADWRNLCEQFGIGDKSNTAVKSLSGGERQRLFTGASRNQDLRHFTENIGTRFKALAYERAKQRNRLRRMHDSTAMQSTKEIIYDLTAQMAGLRRQMKLCEDIAERCGVIEMVVNEIERGQIAEKKKPAEKKKCEKGIDI